MTTDGAGKPKIGEVVADEPQVRRSPIDVRRQFVHGLRPGLEVFVPQAIKAVVAAGGNAAPLRELERDDELHADTVAAAVVELRRLGAPAVEAAASAQPPPMPDLGDTDRETLLALRKGVLATSVLDGRGSTKRAREKLVMLGLIEPCGSGKSKRGVWKLTAKGHTVADRAAGR